MDNHPNRLVQFNGEMVDFQLNLDVDHRKRRRNRTTQSCLNCHTSKRKVRHSLILPRIPDFALSSHSVTESVLAQGASN